MLTSSLYNPDGKHPSVIVINGKSMERFYAIDKNIAPRMPTMLSDLSTFCLILFALSFILIQEKPKVSGSLSEPLLNS